MTMRRAIDAILAQDREELSIIDLHNRISAKIRAKGYERLTRGERLVDAVNWLDMEVNNGGFDQYFTNTSGDHALETVGYLREIGAEHTAGLLQKAMSVFPDATPPRDQMERGYLLMDRGEDVEEFLYGLDRDFYQGSDNISGLLVAYVKRNKWHFHDLGATSV
jgi:hypothetical protein